MSHVERIRNVFDRFTESDYLSHPVLYAFHKKYMTAADTKLSVTPFDYFVTLSGISNVDALCEVVCSELGSKPSKQIEINVITDYIDIEPEEVSDNYTKPLITGDNGEINDNTSDDEALTQIKQSLVEYLNITPPDISDKVSLTQEYKDTRRRSVNLFSNKRDVFSITHYINRHNSFFQDKHPLCRVTVQTDPIRANINDLVDFVPIKFSILDNCYSTSHVKLIKEHPLTTACKSSITTNTTILTALSQMIYDGNARSGALTNQAQYLRCTSLCLANDLYKNKYPTQSGNVSYFPYVVTIKSPNDYQFTLPITNNKISSMIGITMKFNPSNNIPNQDKYTYDTRLVAAKFTPEAKEEFTQLVHNLFDIAKVLGKQNIIVDELGISDHWLPVYDAANIIVNIARQNVNRFQSITIATNNDTTYNAFNHYF